MIHNPLSSAYGNVEKLKKQIELLDTVKEAILDIYCSKSKLSREEISEKMNSEKWYRATEALEAGFVDEIVENDNSLENIKNISNELHIENFINQDLLKEKLKEIENIKNIGGITMPKSVKELLNEYPDLMNDYRNQIINEIGENQINKIEAAIKAERERIQILDGIPTLNDSQKEIINKAKFEEPRDPKDIMAEFFMSNANKANQEIQTSKTDISNAGLDKIPPSNTDLGDSSVENEIYEAALNIYNDENK